MNYIKKIIFISINILIISRCNFKNANNMNSYYQENINNKYKHSDADIVEFVSRMDILEQNINCRNMLIAKEYNNKYSKEQQGIRQNEENILKDMMITLKEQDYEAYKQLSQNEKYYNEHINIQYFYSKKTELQEKQERLVLQIQNDALYEDLNFHYLYDNNHNKIIINDNKQLNDDKKEFEEEEEKENLKYLNNDIQINQNNKNQTSKIYFNKKINKKKKYDIKKFDIYDQLILKGDIQLFNNLILNDKDFDIDILNKKNETLVLKACRYGNLDFLKRLIELGGSLNDYNINGENCVIYACKYSNLNILKYLSKKMSLKTKTNNYDTPLHFASYKSASTDILEFLLSKHLEINSTNSLNETPLIVCKNKNIFKYFLRKDADFTIKTKYNWLPLYSACLMSCFSGVKFIVEELENRNFNSNQFKQQLNIALILTCSKGNKKITKFLLEKGADINYISTFFNNGKYKKIYASILKLLSPNLYSFINKNSFINSLTPIAAAIISNDIKFIKFLKKDYKNININLNNHSNISPVEYAYISNNSDIIKLFIYKYKAKINDQTKSKIK